MCENPRFFAHLVLNNLHINKIRVNTHTHTFLPRVIYAKYLKNQSICKPKETNKKQLCSTIIFRRNQSVCQTFLPKIATLSIKLFIRQCCPTPLRDGTPKHCIFNNTTLAVGIRRAISEAYHFLFNKRNHSFTFS